MTAAAAAAGGEARIPRTAARPAPRRRSDRMASDAPRSPTHRCQPNGLAASIATRARMPGGSTRRGIAGGCAANSSQEGSRDHSRRHPVALELLGRGERDVHLGAGRDEDGRGAAWPARAARSRPVRTSAAVRKPRSAPAASGASATSTVGPSFRSMRDPPRLHGLGGVGRAERHQFGMARSIARCSIGWWVGPSSPTPIESWVPM